MNGIEDLFLHLPITEAARQTAQQFAREQPTAEKAEQVRLNTLAVWVVNDYLHLMGIPTNLTAGDSWNPIVRLCADVADLEVTGVGRLECRPLLALSPTCPIPPEVWSDRIGYVVVRLSESLREGTLLGFTPTAAAEELPLAQLQPPEALLTYLSQLRQPVTSTMSAAAERTLVNLSRWLEGVFETGWQAVEELLAPTELGLAFSFRSTDHSGAAELSQPDAGIRRAKLIDLGRQLSDRPVALLVELRPLANQPTTICVQVHPTGDRPYLPPNLQLMVLDESGAVFLDAQSRSADNYLQLQFRGQLGERFGVKVAFGDASATEDFAL